jgi:hypothetical protein
MRGLLLPYNHSVHAMEALERCCIHGVHWLIGPDTPLSLYRPRGQEMPFMNTVAGPQYRPGVGTHGPEQSDVAIPD